MSQLEEPTPDNWQDFSNADIAVMVLGKTDCPACNEWSAELTQALSNNTFADNIRFGKLIINQKGLLNFKKANPWLAEVEQLPFNVIYQKGEIVKKYAGSGIDRLQTRLSRL